MAGAGVDVCGGVRVHAGVGVGADAQGAAGVHLGRPASCDGVGVGADAGAGLRRPGVLPYQPDMPLPRKLEDGVSSGTFCLKTVAGLRAHALRQHPVSQGAVETACPPWSRASVTACRLPAQGMIMGTKTSLSMLIGALLGELRAHRSGARAPAYVASPLQLLPCGGRSRSRPLPSP